MTQSEQPDTPAPDDTDETEFARPGTVRRRYRPAMGRRRRVLLLIAVPLLVTGAVYWGVIVPKLQDENGTDNDRLATRFDLSW